MRQCIFHSKISVDLSSSYQRNDGRGWFVRVQSSIVDHERGIARDSNSRSKREKELSFSNWIFFVDEWFSWKKFIIYGTWCWYWSTTVYFDRGKNWIYITSKDDIICCKIITYSRSQKSLCDILFLKILNPPYLKILI